MGVQAQLASTVVHAGGVGHEEKQEPLPAKDEELAKGVKESMLSATEFENAAVQRAIIDSKAVESDDGVVLLRLNRHAQAAAVEHA